ncbi:sec1 family domain-containing protein 2-like [Carlito syrichta]|uniref:Sec1 family domain-containing protein 2-like n=1 Tax=Carlito syrichta TaxID=1868482 RepID=A0A3Q0DWW8_CARSF|nr:sec1 family domain-containing protein 2-like [Carlito syrichta]
MAVKQAGLACRASDWDASGGALGSSEFVQQGTDVRSGVVVLCDFHVLTGSLELLSWRLQTTSEASCLDSIAVHLFQSVSFSTVLPGECTPPLRTYLPHGLDSPPCHFPCEPALAVAELMPRGVADMGSQPWRSMAGVSKCLQACSADNRNIGESALSAVLSQLLPMIKPSTQRTHTDYSPDELLALLIYLYSVAGEVVADKDLGDTEEKVKDSLARVFCEEAELSPLLQKITGCNSSARLTFPRSQTATDELFTSLRDVAGARDLLRQFKSVYIPGSQAHQASYKPLLRQIVEDIFSPERPDPGDIEHMSAGLTDLLKTGFSMFLKVSRPHPSDHPVLILFVVGGVTVSEARMVKDLVAALKPGTQVTVLSTRLLRPLDVPELLFATDRLHPDLGI